MPLDGDDEPLDRAIVADRVRSAQRGEGTGKLSGLIPELLDERDDLRIGLGCWTRRLRAVSALEAF